MNFGEAIQAMKDGQLVRRPDWGEEGKYIYLEDWCEGKAPFGPDGRKYEPTVVMFVEHRRLLDAFNDEGRRGRHHPGYTPSQADMLAGDWQLVAQVAG